MCIIKELLLTFFQHLLFSMQLNSSCSLSLFCHLFQTGPIFSHLPWGLLQVAIMEFSSLEEESNELEEELLLSESDTSPAAQAQTQD